MKTMAAPQAALPLGKNARGIIGLREHRRLDFTELVLGRHSAEKINALIFAIFGTAPGLPLAGIGGG